MLVFNVFIEISLGIKVVLVLEFVKLLHIIIKWEKINGKVDKKKAGHLPFFLLLLLPSPVLFSLTHQWQNNGWVVRERGKGGWMDGWRGKENGRHSFEGKKATKKKTAGRRASVLGITCGRQTGNKNKKCWFLNLCWWYTIYVCVLYLFFLSMQIHGWRGQMSEWGMQLIKAEFGCLYDHGKPVKMLIAKVMWIRCMRCSLGGMEFNSYGNCWVLKSNGRKGLSK